jgi:hypothetical protein
MGDERVLVNAVHLVHRRTTEDARAQGEREAGEMGAQEDDIAAGQGLEAAAEDADIAIPPLRPARGNVDLLRLQLTEKPCCSSPRQISWTCVAAAVLGRRRSKQR